MNELEDFIRKMLILSLVAIIGIKVALGSYMHFHPGWGTQQTQIQPANHPAVAMKPAHSRSGTSAMEQPDADYADYAKALMAPQ